MFSGDGAYVRSRFLPSMDDFPGNDKKVQPQYSDESPRSSWFENAAGKWLSEASPNAKLGLGAIKRFVDGLEETHHREITGKHIMHLLYLVDIIGADDNSCADKISNGNLKNNRTSRSETTLSKFPTIDQKCSDRFEEPRQYHKTMKTPSAEANAAKKFAKQINFDHTVASDSIFEGHTEEFVEQRKFSERISTRRSKLFGEKSDVSSNKSAKKDDNVNNNVNMIDELADNSNYCLWMRKILDQMRDKALKQRKVKRTKNDASNECSGSPNDVSIVRNKCEKAMQNKTSGDFGDRSLFRIVEKHDENDVTLEPTLRSRDLGNRRVARQSVQPEIEIREKPVSFSGNKEPSSNCRTKKKKCQRSSSVREQKVADAALIRLRAALEMREDFKNIQKSGKQDVYNERSHLLPYEQGDNIILEKPLNDKSQSQLQIMRIEHCDSGAEPKFLNNKPEMSSLLPEVLGSSCNDNNLRPGFSKSMDTNHFRNIPRMLRRPMLKSDDLDRFHLNSRIFGEHELLKGLNSPPTPFEEMLSLAQKVKLAGLEQRVERFPRRLGLREYDLPKIMGVVQQAMTSLENSRVAAPSKKTLLRPS